MTEVHPRQVLGRLRRLVRSARGGFRDHCNFPQAIHVENTNHCNARCTICAMDRMTRPKGIMGLELFTKIVREMAGRWQARELHVHGFGEPLIDRHLVDKIRIAKELGVPYVYFVSNGSLLGPELATELVGSGLDRFKISFYGMSKESYEAVHRGLEFETTLRNIEGFLKIRKNAGKGPALRLQFAEMGDNRDELVSLVRYWQDRIDPGFGDRLYLSGLHNWAGGKSYNQLVKPECERMCSWPFRNVQILWDGTVIPCVYDYDGVHKLGDVSTDRLQDIWRGAEYERFRGYWRRRQSLSLELCARCDEPDGLFQARPIPEDLLAQAAGTSE